MSDPIQGWERLLLAVQRARQHAGASSLEYDDSDEAVSAARRLGLDGSAGRLGEGTLASLLPPALQQNSEIGDVLTAASEVETMDAPEVARILADYAYTLAQRLDPNSEGRGVLQFKTSLHTLLRARRQAQSAPPSDKVKAIRDFFTKYREHIQKLEEDSENNREALGKAWKTARVLGKVLEEISGTERVQVDRELAQDIKEAAEKTEEFKKQKYNIVPLGIEDASEPILQLREVQIALQFLSHPEGLPQHPHGGSFADILEYLQFTFGFQEDNVNNQREHLVLLMANDLTHQMLLPDTHPMPALKVAVQELYNKVLANFFRWGDFVKADRAYLRNLDSVQGQLLHVALYFLIWGEAANVRFVPECLCYIFHRMAEELCELAKKPVAGKSAAISLPVGSAEEAGPYAFLDNVISPIYAVISKEAEYAGHGTTAKGHQKWRNYDDLNEFFWSERCLKLGWPLDLDHGFFTFPPQEAKEMLSEEDPLLTAPTAVPMAGRQQPKRRARRLSKTLFVEWRTFWHIFHSFDRLWIFLIIMLQASKAFLQRIRRYEKEHKRCTDPERVKRSFAQDTVQAETVTAKTCKYAIHRGAGGLGNQMQGLVSSFLYALLTNRTLLVERGQDMDLFCEPFAFSSWYLEPEMEQRVMQEMEMRRTNVVELQREREEGRPLPNKAFLFLKWDDSAEEETFFCDDFQIPLANISWLYLHQARYLAPGFVAMESFRSEIERLFPDRMIYTHLARYLLHPNNTFWESITGAYDDYFRTADKRVGIQVRTFAHTDEWANERVLQCAWNVSQVLPPPLDPQAWEELLRQQVPPEQRTEHVRQMSKNNSPRNIFAFVASMHGHHVRHLRWVYMDGIAADGSNVTFHSLSSVEGESWDLNAHAQALLEVWLLSFCDELLTSAHSTFGALAAALAGYPPYLLNIADHAYGKFDDPEDCWRTSKRPVCWRLGSADPCAIPFSRSLCSVEGAQFPPNKPAYLRPCDDQPANWQIYP